MSTKIRDSYWTAVKGVIREADVLLLLLDARFVDETRNAEIENKVRAAGKPLIYVITKADLANKEKLEACKRALRPSVFVSAKDRTGRKRLKERIIVEAERAYGGGGKTQRITVGVLGYPNVGKSSLINYMKGRRSAPISSHSGCTKSTRLVKTDSRIYFIDTPGVIPYLEKDELKHATTSVTDFTKVKEPDLIVAELMRKYPGRIEAHFNVPVREDKLQSIEEITLKSHVLRKGGLPDIDRMCRSIIRDFQSGKIKI